MADSVKAVSEVLSSFQKKEGATIQPKEFFWDQFLKYITSAILALTVLNVSVEFLRGGGVSCFPPSNTLAVIREELEGGLYEFARGQTSYINSYCARNVPITEYFPIYILVHGLLLIAPHYVWSAIHNGDFDSFFAIVEKLDRLRDSSTGEYDAKNFDRVTKLELEYSGTKIFVSYILKLVLQLFICIGSIVFSAAYFVNFSFSFYCPEEVTSDMPDGWPLNITVPCVYTSLRILGLIRYADFVLLAIALLLVVFGLFWCCVRHTAQLGYVQLAKFAFQSCLKSENFVFPPIFSWPSYPCFSRMKSKSKVSRWILTHYPKIHLRNVFSPRILHDLDFLLLMLFRADSSHGQVFKDIQINRELKRLVGRDHQLLHLYINIQQELSQLNPPEANETPPQHEQDSNNSGEERQSHAQTPPPHEQDPNDCCVCLTNLFFDIESVNGSDDSEEEQQSHAERAREDFHTIFHVSEFNGDAERIAYEQYKPYFGRISYNAEYMKGIRDTLYWFVTNFGPCYPPTDANSEPSLKNSLALDISFGSIGYALVLARPFIKVMSVKFQPHYHNSSNQPGVLDEFYTNYVTFKYPNDLYSQSSDSITGAHGIILKFIRDLPSGPDIPPARLDFILIGPITEESKLVSVNLLLNTLKGEGRIGKDAILLAIRPLKVGSHKVCGEFFKFEPSKESFNHRYHRDKVNPKIPPESQHYVDGCAGIKVNCGSTPCVFEMIAYQFHGKVKKLFDVKINASPAGHQASPQTNNAQTQARGTIQGDHTNSESHNFTDSGNCSPTTTAPYDGMGHNKNARN